MSRRISRCSWLIVDAVPFGAAGAGRAAQPQVDLETRLRHDELHRPLEKRVVGGLDHGGVEVEAFRRAAGRRPEIVAGRIDALADPLQRGRIVPERREVGGLGLDQQAELEAALQVAHAALHHAAVAGGRRRPRRR